MDTAEYAALRHRINEGIGQLDGLVERIETEEEIPLDTVLPALAEMGALGLLVPSSYGGAGLTISQYLPIIAAFAKCHGGIRALVHVHNSFAHAIAEHATEQQRRELLPGTATAERSIAFALTEPEFGTGLDLGTTARRSGDGYAIDGSKWLITNSNFASHFIVFAKLDEPGAIGPLTALIVARDAPGLTIEPLPETMGCKGAAHGRLTFDGVWTPAENVLGGVVGDGARQLEEALEISRVLVAASSLGVAEEALALSVRRAQERVTFGKPIATRQAVQRYLAEMATDVYALRGMLQDAAAKCDRGERIPAEASMCKLFGLEAVGRVTDRALLVHGGIGYTRAHRIEMLYRDARLNWLEEGPPTIQYLSAARALLDGYAWPDLAESSPAAAIAG